MHHKSNKLNVIQLCQDWLVGHPAANDDVSLGGYFFSRWNLAPDQINCELMTKHNIPLDWCTMIIVMRWSLILIVLIFLFFGYVCVCVCIQMCCRMGFPFSNFKMIFLDMKYNKKNQPKLLKAKHMFVEYWRLNDQWPHNSSMGSSAETHCYSVYNNNNN